MKNTAKRILCTLLAAVMLLGLSANAMAAEYNWKQGDSKWKKVSGLSSFPASGCAVTAIAIQIGRSGLVSCENSATSFDPSTGQGFNPGTFAKLWRSKGGLSKGCSVSWGTVSKVVPGFKHTVYVDGTGTYTKSRGNGAFSCYPAGSNKAVAQAMEMYLSMGYYPVIEGPGSKRAHYVAVIAASGANETVTIVDPSDGRTKDLFADRKWSSAKLDKQSASNKGKGCCVLYQVTGAPVVTPAMPTPAPVVIPTLPTPEPVVIPTQPTPEPVVIPDPMVIPDPPAPEPVVIPEPPVSVPAPTAPVTVNDPSSISITGVQAPTGDMPSGAKFYFNGLISSNYALQSVSAMIFSAAGEAVQSKTVAPYTTQLDIYSQIDPYLKFGRLGAGSYVYVVTATDVQGYTAVLVESAFTVGAAADPVETAGVPITISGVQAPSGVMSNSAKFYFNGMISSQHELVWVEGGIYREDGSGVQTGRFERGGTTFDVYKTIDRVIKFKKLGAGSYVYRIVAADVMGNVVTLVESPFSIA